MPPYQLNACKSNQPNPSPSSFRRAAQKPIKLSKEPYKVVSIQFHIIRKRIKKGIPKTRAPGHVPMNVLEEQIKVMNTAFGQTEKLQGTNFDTRLRFKLHGVKYYDNTDWFENCGNFPSLNDETGEYEGGDKDLEIKNATTIENTKLMNVWSCSAYPFLGWAW